MGIHVAPPLFAAPPVYGYVPPPPLYGYVAPSFDGGVPPAYDPYGQGYAPSPHAVVPQGYAAPGDPYAASIATGGAKW